MPEVDGLELDLAGLDGLSRSRSGTARYDPSSRSSSAAQARQRVQEAGADVLYREYPLPHTIDPGFLPELRASSARDRGAELRQRCSTEGLAELHTHLGGSVASDILWCLAHEQGIALPVKDYWEFDALVTVSDPRGVENLDALDAIYHWTELIQSSPLAVERSVHGAIGGAYRSQRITTLELRFNPMKRNRGGERDLDHIILAAVRGLDRARLEYPQVRAGLILMMDRTFDARQNEIIVEKAIRWADARHRRHRHRRARARAAAATTTRSRADGRDRARGRASASRSTSARRARPARRRSARSSSTCGPTGSATASSRRTTRS